MLDFTSALYLGMRHASAALGPWEALSLGRPAALESPPGAEALSERLATLQGLEAATLLPSTLHLFHDLFKLLARRDIAVLIDACAYPIARWGAEHVAASGIPTVSFAHHDAGALAEEAQFWAQCERRPIILADGYCPGCECVAPLSDYAAIAARHGGWLVLDDTQALGILGATPSEEMWFGTGGGGPLRWHHTDSRNVVVGASLAKAFGAPLAVLAGTASLVARFRGESETLVHCSPPSVAAIRAAHHALELNGARGESLRNRLALLVARLRNWAVRAGLRLVGQSLFPMQSFGTAWCGGAITLQARLLRAGVRTVVTRACDDLTSRLTFLVTARHRLADVDLAGRLLIEAARGGPSLLAGQGRAHA